MDNRLATAATAVYTAGFDTTEIDVILKSAAITAIICAILSAAIVLYLNRKK